MTQDAPHILVVDDDERLRTLIAQYLTDQGFFVTDAQNAAEARKLVARFRFDAMVLDVMMPGETGLDFLASLPKTGRAPALILSARGEATARIEGLEAGAEDYLPKPFEPKELVLRLRTILRRNGGISAVTFGPFEFNPATQQLKQGEEIVYLTGGEAQLLKTLAESAGTPVSREALAGALLIAASDRSIDVQITRLRKKIEANPGKSVYIQTVRGVGYLLAATAKGRG